MFGKDSTSEVASRVLACIERQDFAQAEELCREGLQQAADDYPLQLAYAQISLQQGDFAQARERFVRVREQFPERTEGHLGGALACLGEGDYKNAGNFCSQAIYILKKERRAGLELYYSLTEACLRIPGFEEHTMEMFTLLEGRDRRVRSESRYYYLLFTFVWPLIVRQEEDSGSDAIDFALLRLLRQPPAGEGELLGLNLLYSTILSNAAQSITLLGQMIDRLVDTHDLDSPLAVMASGESSDERRSAVLAQLLKKGSYVYSVKLCLFNDRNQPLLAEACRRVLEQGHCLKLGRVELFNLARTMNFADQDLGDKLVAAVYEHFQSQQLPLSDPLGLLCHRHRRRQQLLEAGQALPVRQRGERLRIALCFSGQLRGYHGTYEQLQEALGLQHHDCQVFVHTWEEIGVVFDPRRVLSAKRSLYGEFLYAFIQCFEGMEDAAAYLRTQYPTFHALISSSGRADLAELQEYFNTQEVVVEPGSAESFQGWSSSQCMHYKVCAAHKLAQRSGGEFDLEIRCRPDLYISKKEDIDLVDVYARSRDHGSILTCRGLNRYTTHLSLSCGYSIDDSFAIGTPLAMSVYCNTYDDLAEHIRLGTYACPREFKGHQTLEHNLYCAGVHIDEFLGIKSVIEVNRMPFRNPRIPVSLIYEALRRDVACRELTRHDELLIGACKKQLRIA